MQSSLAGPGPRTLNQSLLQALFYSIGLTLILCTLLTLALDTQPAVKTFFASTIIVFPLSLLILVTSFLAENQIKTFMHLSAVVVPSILINLAFILQDVG